jgi:ATP-binding cassette subfamily B protein
MVLIALLAYSMAISKGGLAAAMPALGALALGAQRLMPLIQQAYQSWIQVSGNRQLLHDVVVLLQQPVSEEVRSDIKRLPFDREIRFEQVSFRYQPKQPFVLEKIDLTFAKGGRIGFVGTTGSGKSTAMDLLMGLLQPTDGLIRVDGIPLTEAARLCWQSNIAHVPQAIYLTDTSFADNIAFGIPPEKIDLSRVRKAAFQAQISEFIDSQPAGYNSIVGERGVRLSGGQRQRIAIARALYKQADVIVFDEATSALDNETELAVMGAIAGLSKDITIFIIAHRISTLKNCTQIVELMAGGGIRVGTYQDILSSSHESVEKPGT